MAASNLQKIWETKKVELNFTQKEAGKKLGWSQGAISQYLNNITELNPQAVIKLANFLEVDPERIDPSITEYTPQITQKEVKFSCDGHAQNYLVTIDQHVDTFCVSIDSDDNDLLPSGALVTVCEKSKVKNVRRTTKNKPMWVVQLKGEKQPFKLVHDEYVKRNGKSLAKKFVAVQILLH